MNILAFPREALGEQLEKPTLPFEAASIPADHVFAPRPDLETDPRYLQLITYAVLRRSDGQVWTYQRTGGDGRVKGRKSIGVGGHVDAVDQHIDCVLSTSRNALIRELSEELVNPPQLIPQQPIGWINEQISEIGRVHIGLVWDITWMDETAPPQPAEGETLEGIGFQPLTAIREANGFELWSELACKLLI